MMCSSWKISIFGILALMLAFGMATDALAAAKTAQIAVANISNLRAIDETTSDNHITFTITPQSGGDAGGSLSIEIPSGWPNPFHQNSGTAASAIDEAGEVHISDGGTGDNVRAGSISGRKLVATYGKGSPEAVVFTYKSKHPARAQTYSFPITGNMDITQTVAAEGADGLKKRSGKFYFDISVHPVASGQGRGHCLGHIIGLQASRCGAENVQRSVFPSQQRVYRRIDVHL